MVCRALPALLLALGVLALGCEPDDTTTPPPVGMEPDRVRPGDQLLPPGTVITPGSELERRVNGECILFDPWQDGREDRVCLMTTPQNGTLGRLGPEGEAGTAGGGTGSSSGALLDSPPSPLPARVNHRSQYLDGCMTVGNQHACGWCVVHAATAVLEALHCSKGCDVPELSEPHLRSNSLGGRAFGSCAEGWNTTTALQTLVADPIVDNETWPYVANGRGQNAGRPSDSVLGMAGHQPTGMHTVDLTNLNAIKNDLASEREVIISVPVYYDNSNAAMPMNRGDWNSGTANVRTPPTASPCSCGSAACTTPMCLGGYHAIVLTGYDDSTMQFQFLNSWGKGWGDTGYGTMDYAFVTNEGFSGAALDDVNTDIPGNACSDDLTDAGTDAGPSDTGSPSDGGMPDSAMVTPDAGPVVPVPGDPCSTTGDCATCTALSGCGWCEGTGCRQDSSMSSCMGTWHAEVCPATADPCAPNGTCDTCAGTAGCVWCGDTNTCYSPSMRTADCGDPRNAPDQCANCGAGTDCGSCVGMAGCGWCPGSSVGVVAPGTMTGNCVLGSEDAPDRTSCAAYRGTEEDCNSDECSLISDCDACIDSENCGWCDGSDQCMLGGFFGPVDDERFGSTCGDDWDWFGFACDNTDASCGDTSSCRECVRSAVACEWDDTNSVCNDPMMSMGGMVFTMDSQCPAPCGGPFSMCTDSDQCCDGLACVNGDCVDCGGAAGVTDTCNPTDANACCGTLVCSRATGGGNTCCRSDTDACDSDDECCGDMTCSGGACLCRNSGESCQAGRECCGASFCDAGTCT